MRTLNIINVDTACWIARLGSFTAAAERLHTTQPAISARVRELESALGITIFLRQGRGVELTIEGREFVRKAEPLLRQLEDLSNSVGNATDVSGLVRIGTGNIAMSWVPSVIIALKQTFPRVTYDFEVNRAGRLLQRVAARKLDLAIVAGAVDPQKFISISLGFDRMLWVTSPTFLGTMPGANTQALLEGGPLWCVQRESHYWGDAIQRVLDCGASIDTLNAIDNMAAAVQMIARGAGIGLLSETMIQSELKAGTLVPVPGLRQSDPVELFVVCPKGDPERVVLQIMSTMATMSTFDRDVPGTIGAHLADTVAVSEAAVTAVSNTTVVTANRAKHRRDRSR